jgi:hypothetical protein
MPASASPHAAPDMRTCNACSTLVHRDEVHKNRYGQYICKVCRASGVRAVGRRRVHDLARRIPTALVAFLVVVVVLVVLPLAFMALSQLHGYSNAGMVQDLKDMVRSINQLAR